jgi:hypothetical protein
LFALFSFLSFSQEEKNEREIRIKKTDFPSHSLDLIAPYLQKVTRLRFYKEYDGEKSSFEAKFKKQRLLFSVEFDSTGTLEDIEFRIKKVDIPHDSWKAIETYIDQNFKNTRIKKIQQQYVVKTDNAKLVLKDAFQNLIKPYINYELIISSKDAKGFQEYELLFNAEGKFISSRKSIPQKYDHVLY